MSAENPTNKLKSFEFEVVTVNERGETINREQKKAEYYTENLGSGLELDMFLVSGGTVRISSPKRNEVAQEPPSFPVIVPSFFMGKYPVTQKQWRAIASLHKSHYDLESDPSYFQGNQRPVEQISWYEAVEFCQRLSQATGRKYRLPTEAEWEYACRAGTTTPFHFGQTITLELANYTALSTYAQEPPGKARGKTTPVGSFPPNAFGLYDLHGNVWEWCEDDWSENYPGVLTDQRNYLLNTGKTKVIRGGSWDDVPSHCRSAFRDLNYPVVRVNCIGFRVIHDALGEFALSQENRKD